jgi:hypothetical protein
MKTIKCDKCGTDIGYVNYSRHIKSCNGIAPKKKEIKIHVSNEWKQEDGLYKCPYCDKKYSKKGIGNHIWKTHTEEGQKHNPNIGYKNGTRVGANTGKHHSEEIKNKISESEKLTISLNGHCWTGKHHSKETKNKISQKRVEYLENNDQYTLWYKVSNGNRIVNVQGTWEKRFAEYLNSNNIKWDRFHIKYEGHRRYTPDFYLLEYNLFIEVKGWMKDRDINKMKRFLNDNPNCDIRLVDSLEIFEKLEKHEINLSELIKFIDKY